MPRDIPIGNGALLVTFDQHYFIRDLYWPHVGEENQTLGNRSRFGVWTEGRFAWLEGRQVPAGGSRSPTRDTKA